MIGLLGKKLGMTHVYDAYGRRIGVTAVLAGPCTILQIREPAKHKYAAVQLGFDPIIDDKKVTKPLAGQFKKLNAGPFRYVRELRLDNGKTGGEELKPGQQLTVALFKEWELVDVQGISIGKGFQGGMKRWGWHGGNETHGSMSHRAPGSIGSTTTPGRVVKGHHLPGHMGNRTTTVQNIRIAAINAEKNMLLLQGAVPGGDNSLIFIARSVKRPGVLKKPQEILNIVDEDDANLSKTAKAAKKKPATQKATAA